MNTYYIEKIHAKWRIMFVPMGYTCGATIGHYKTCKAATTVAHLLAGRYANVTVVKTPRRKHADQVAA